MTAGASWGIVETRGLAGLQQLEPEWRRIYASMEPRTSYHAFEAQLAYARHLMASPDRLRCLALSDGQQVRAICLLEPAVDRSLKVPLRVWRVPTPSHLPWGDIICPGDDARREAIPALVRHLHRHPEGAALVQLGPLPSDSILWLGLDGLRPAGHCRVPAWDTDVIDCTRPAEQALSRLSKNFRANLRKASNKLNKLADVRYVAAVDQPDVAAEFEAFLDIEASGWKGRAGTGTAIRFRDGQPAFFRELVTQYRGDQDRCEVHALYAEGHCIASQLCTRTGSDYAILKTAYDESYARVAPGQLLCRAVLERACEDPSVDRLDLVGDADWHSDWRPESRELRTTCLALDSWRGSALITLFRLRHGPARRLARWVRTRLPVEGGKEAGDTGVHRWPAGSGEDAQERSTTDR